MSALASVNAPMCSCACRFQPNYELHLEYVDGQERVTRERDICESVTKFFDERGELHEELFAAPLVAAFNELAKGKKAD